MKSLIKKTKVIYWYNGLLIRNEFKKAYQLEKFYEPESFYYPEEGGTKYRNKWAKYRDGKHAPNPDLIDKVESKSYGSSREFYHPFWQVLLLQQTDAIDLDYWFKQLDLETQLLCSRNTKKEGLLTKSRKGFYDFKLANKLFNQENLDSLTALILYWHEAGLNGSSSFQSRLAKLIYKHLLTMAVHFEGRGIAGEIYRVLSDLIFIKTLWDNCTFFESLDYFRISYKVLDHVWIKVKKVRLDDLSKSEMFWFQGKFDCAFSSILLPNWIYGPPRKADWVEWNEEFTRWMWGWYSLVKPLNYNYAEFCYLIEKNNYMSSSLEFFNEFILPHYGSHIQK